MCVRVIVRVSQKPHTYHWSRVPLASHDNNDTPPRYPPEGRGRLRWGERSIGLESLQLWYVDRVDHMTLSVLILLPNVNNDGFLT